MTRIETNLERSDVSRTVSRRPPTLKQAAKLMVLGSGNIALAPGRGDWGPLVRRGWVEAIDEDDADKRFLPPLRITPDGLRALAGAMEVHRELVPDLKPGDRPRQVNEPPTVTRLKAELSEAREERDRARRDEHHTKIKLRKAKRVLEGVDQPW